MIVFLKLNGLHLLKDLYGRVDYPFAVYKESVNVEIIEKVLIKMLPPI